MGRTQVDVLIVTALKEELDSVLEVEGRGAWEQVRDRDNLLYHVRDLPNEQGEVLRVAAAWAGEMGESAAAVRAMGLINELEPACLAMSGICAGRRGKVFLGDVIVAERVFSYDHGKLVAPREGDEGGFFHDIATFNLAAVWKVDATYFAEEFLKSWQTAVPRPLSKEAQKRWLLLATHEHEQGTGQPPGKHPERKERCPNWTQCVQELMREGLIESAGGQPKLTERGRERVEEMLLLYPDGPEQDPPFRVHVAPVATGKTVREDPQLFERLARHERKVLGVEMEAAAIGLVAERLSRRALIVKAVSDYADHEKDDAFRQFACHASASFLLAFLRKHLYPRQPEGHPQGRGRQRRYSEGEGEAVEVGRRGRRDNLLSRVERACELHEPEGLKIVHKVGPSPFDLYLEVSVRRWRFPRIYPLGVLDHPITQEALEIFIQTIHAEYRQGGLLVDSVLVHNGQATPPELLDLATREGVNLVCAAEYQGFIDFSEYLRRQTERLASDPIYPPASYVEQRGLMGAGGQQAEAVEDALATVRELLNTPERRFVLVLGDFGTGKTFLLHELARRMGEQKNPAQVPVLIEMRSLQKQRSLRELVAQHFAPERGVRFEMEKFLYMLEEGRIVLLFDGFDELALRVTYDRALEHFDTLLEAARGKAKVVVTSRTQHFLTDGAVKRELARRAEALQGYQLIKLERFSEQQIRRFLVKRLGGEAEADRRMALLRDVRDLLGLSENPRLLSFIVGLEAEQLQAAREGSGEITSASLYRLLIEKWLEGEYKRVNPPGAPKGLSVEQLWHGATELALLLWGRTERTVGMDELPTELWEAVSARGEQLEAEKVKHQLGSGSLLVRDEEGRFSFVHQSVMEWLVAQAAARELGEKGETVVLGRRQVSDLMADFFIALARPERARAWAEAKSAAVEDEVGKLNALKVLTRLHQEDERRGRARSKAIKNFEGSDLRDQDLSDADLRGANLKRTNLSGVPMVGADLTGAQLQEAQLVRADLRQARLRGADLTGADLSGANLLGADLRGARLQGARLRGAKLLDTRVDSWEGCDTFGAALPGKSLLESQLAAGSACGALAFSPVDEVLATGHEDGALRLWDPVKGVTLRVLWGHTQGISSIEFSPDGILLASASDDRTIRLWSIADNKIYRTLDHDLAVNDVAFSPSGERVASACANGVVYVWNVADGKCLFTLRGHQQHASAVAFSPDGMNLASASLDGTVRIWNMVSGQEDVVLKGALADVLDVSYATTDGQPVVLASNDGGIRLWRVGGQPEVEKLGIQPREDVGGITCSSDGKTIASISGSIVNIWSFESGQKVCRLGGHDGRVVDISFNSDGSTLASVDETGLIRLWSAAEGRLLRVFEEQAGANEILGLAFLSSNEDHIVCIDENASLTTWSFALGQLVEYSMGGAGLIQKVAFSLDGSCFVCVEVNSSLVQLRQTVDGKFLRKFEIPKMPVRMLRLSPDGSYLVCVSKNLDVRLWSARTGHDYRIPQVLAKGVYDAAFSPDGKLLALACADGAIMIWNLLEQSFLRLPKAHKRAINGLFFSRDGACMVSLATAEQKLRIWRVSEKGIVSSGKVIHASARDVILGPTGDSLVCVTLNGAVQLWDIKSAQVSLVYEWFLGDVLSMAFNSDGTLIALASAGGRVDVYEVSSGDCRAKFMKVSDGWVAVRNDGRYKSSGSVAGVFWYAQGLCRFEPEEFSFYLETPLRLKHEEAFLLRPGSEEQT